MSSPCLLQDVSILDQSVFYMSFLSIYNAIYHIIFFPSPNILGSPGPFFWPIFHHLPALHQWAQVLQGGWGGFFGGPSQDPAPYFVFVIEPPETDHMLIWCSSYSCGSWVFHLHSVEARVPRRETEFGKHQAEYIADIPDSHWWKCSSFCLCVHFLNHSFFSTPESATNESKGLYVVAKYMKTSLEVGKCTWLLKTMMNIPGWLLFYKTPIR